MKTKLYFLYYIVFGIFSGIVGVSFIPNPVDAQTPCTLVENGGQFRNFDFGVAFPLNPVDWFSASVAENSVQPYVYLDLKFSPSCVGASGPISVQIHEHDSLFFDSNEVVLVVPDFTITNADQLQKTFVFKAGDVGCDVGDSGDCDYFLYLIIDGEEESFSPGMGGVGTQSHPLNIEYDCVEPCGNQQWGYVAVVNDTYGQYIHPEDPDFLALQEGDGTQMENEGGTEGENEGGTQAENNEPLLSVDELETIDNPLGDGSSLPAFVNSIIGIFIRFMIPIIVLAYIYTGFRYVLAQGNPEKLREAHKLFLYVVIGSAIVLGAWTIATIITTTVNAIL